ncbi:hypothetical protein B0A55_10384, partial [Friedmanniomyces simplex]
MADKRKHHRLSFGNAAPLGSVESSPGLFSFTNRPALESPEAHVPTANGGSNDLMVERTNAERIAVEEARRALFDRVGAPTNAVAGSDSLGAGGEQGEEVVTDGGRKSEAATEVTSPVDITTPIETSATNEVTTPNYFTATDETLDGTLNASPFRFLDIPAELRMWIYRELLAPTLLSVDTQQPGWFHVDSADFLDRGHEGSTLAEKLNAYLHTQGVTDRDYAFAYLVTAPRFLGYSFNPVSFWYLYDSDTELKYMILEVNNTFDERRMYLLKGGEVKGEEMDDGSDRPFNGAGKTSKQLVFTDSWTKDFHVSPFNSRKGSYSLRATDPLAEYEQTGRVRIDNTI